MSKLTVIILAKNEEQNIVDCINSAKFADEVLIIDDFSTDKTVQIAESMGARVVQHALENNWAQQRQFGIAEATHEWILFLDSDERISEPLSQEIKSVITNKDKHCYWLPRHNLFHHNTASHGSVRPDRVLRLMPKQGATVEGFVHESIYSPFPEARLSKPLYHYTYDNWEQYFNKFNRYTSAAAKQYKEKNKSCSFIGDIVLRPIWAFVKVYFIQSGFKDGKIGFVLSMNHAFYTMTKYVKLYYLNRLNGKL